LKKPFLHISSINKPTKNQTPDKNYSIETNNETGIGDRFSSARIPNNRCPQLAAAPVANVTCGKQRLKKRSGVLSR
jgi:hypothetical protein